MSRRVFEVLTICVVLTLLLLLSWRMFAPADLGAPPASATPVITAVSASLGANSPTATGAAATPARSEATAPTTPQRRARIVDETGAPVANAEVAFDLSKDLREYRWLQPFDIEARLAAAERHRTATNGVVALPTDAAVAFVIARAGDRFGHDVIGFDNRLLAIPELTIAPDRTLRIAIVGPRGEPRPNVPVEVTFQDEQALVNAGTTSVQLGRSDSSGSATLWHAQTLLFWNRADPTLDLRAIVLGATPPTVRVRLADPVPDRIVLECPDHGGIRVRAWIAAGIPNRAHAQPRIREASGSPAWCESLVMPGASTAEWCLFPLALERQWHVGAMMLEPVEVQGPTRQAEEVQVDLMAAGDESFTIVFLQTDGRPCALQSIEFDPRGSDDRRVGETDANGRLAFSGASRRARQLGQAARSVSFEAPQLHASATVEIPASASGLAPTDLGTVWLQPTPVLAAGRVVDAATGGPLRAFLGSGGRQVASDIEGWFELWGEGGGSIEIAAVKVGYVRTTLQVSVGARDLVIAMRPVRLLRATVLVDPGVAIDDLCVAVRNGEHTSCWRAALIERGVMRGQFELPDGDDLVLEVAGTEGLPVVQSVPMRNWIPEDGAFSATVDLRGMLVNVLVTIRGPGGDPDGSVYVRPAGSAAAWASLHLAARLAIAVPHGTTLDAIVQPHVGMCMRTTLHPGENKIDVPQPSVAQIEVTGVPSGVARNAIAVQVWQLVRREPVLDELVTAGASVDPGEVQNWPHTVADLEHLTDSAGWENFDKDPVRLELQRRGSYVAVPYAFAKEHWLPLLDAATPIEVTTPGAVVEATIRLDPEKVRAALR